MKKELDAQSQLNSKAGYYMLALYTSLFFEKFAGN